MRLTANEIAKIVNGTVHGDGDAEIHCAVPLRQCRENALVYATDEANLQKLPDCAASVAMISEEHLSAVPPGPLTLVTVAGDAEEAFLLVATTMQPPRPTCDVGISQNANIAGSALIGGNANIHPNATIADDAEVGIDCTIYPGAYIGRGVKLGNNVVVHPNVVIYDDCQIGNNCIIHANSVIGADGFGYRHVDGQHKRIPHAGTVRIEDDVEIGACTTIDRAKIGETVIGQGTKIDNQVMVGHNCEVGKHNMLVAKVAFAGSVTTGDYVVCAGQVGVADHVHLGTGAVFGAQSGVHRDMPGGETYLGAPAAPISETRRQLMALRKLPEMRKSLRSVEKELAELKASLSSESIADQTIPATPQDISKKAA